MHLRTRVSPASLFIHKEETGNGSCKFLNNIQMKSITIEGQLRTGLGKQATRQLRSQGNVPGVIYGGAKEISFYAPVIAFKTLIYTPEFQFAEVKLDGTTYRCILKDLQFDKVNDHLIHIDLMELVEDKKVIATIPLKFT